MSKYECCYSTRNKERIRLASLSLLEQRMTKNVKIIKKEIFGPLAPPMGCISHLLKPLLLEFFEKFNKHANRTELVNTMYSDFQKAFDKFLH